MAYWGCHDLFGPSRSMHRPVLRWVKRSQRQRVRNRLEASYKRVKWCWHPQHVLNRRARMRTQMRNDHFMRQLDKCIALLRPPHLRKPVRT